MNIPDWLTIPITAVITVVVNSYFQRKGNNQADKEDIGEITTIVESVKKLNTEEMEFLKTNLSLLTSRKNTIFTEEKEAIIQFNARLSTWLWEAIGISITEYSHTNYKDLSDRIIRLTDNYIQTNIALSKVELLIKDSELIVKAHACVTETLKLHQFLVENMQELKLNLSAQSTLIEMFANESDRVRKKMMEAPESTDFYIIRINELEKERDAIIKKHHSERNPVSTPIHGIKKEFMNHAKEYLNQL